jgi:hypothetical protein
LIPRYQPQNISSWQLRFGLRIRLRGCLGVKSASAEFSETGQRTFTGAVVLGVEESQGVSRARTLPGWVSTSAYTEGVQGDRFALDLDFKLEVAVAVGIAIAV